MLLATDDGVFARGRWGSAWTDLSAGLTDRNVHSLAVQRNTLAAGLDNGGVWTRGLEQVSGIQPADRRAARRAARTPAFNRNTAQGLFRNARGFLTYADGRLVPLR